MDLGPNPDRVSVHKRCLLRGRCSAPAFLPWACIITLDADKRRFVRDNAPPSGNRGNDANASSAMMRRPSEIGGSGCKTEFPGEHSSSLTREYEGR